MREIDEKVIKAKLQEEFLELVAIDSPSWGEADMAKAVKKKLVELGFQVKEDNAGELAVEQGLCQAQADDTIPVGQAGNIYGYLPGELDLPPILFSAHLDTVEPAKGKSAICEADGTIRSAGKAVLGADCLAGMVEILQGIRLAKASGKAHRPIEVLISVAEETYCQGASLFDFSQVQARDSYVLDLTGPVGSAARRAPSLVSFRAQVQGRAAHSGMEPEKGINAIAIMAQILTRIPQGHLDEETTCNVGMINGGRMINIVPDSCTIQGEVRGYDHEKVMSVVEDIATLVEQQCRVKGAKSNFDYTIHIHSYETSTESSAVRRFQDACEALGLSGNLTQTFGGSDQNPLSQHGIQGLVLSNGMYKMHTVEEYTTIEDLYQGSLLVAGLIQSPVE